jgi:hypothetical protein
LNPSAFELVVVTAPPAPGVPVVVGAGVMGAALLLEVETTGPIGFIAGVGVTGVCPVSGLAKVHPNR